MTVSLTFLVSDERDILKNTGQAFVGCPTVVIFLSSFMARLLLSCGEKDHRVRVILHTIQGHKPSTRCVTVDANLDGVSGISLHKPCLLPLPQPTRILRKSPRAAPTLRVEGDAG